MKKCPQCQAEEHQMKAGLTEAGSQRYKCGECQLRYTPEPKERGHPDEVRQKALKLYSRGWSYRRIGRKLRVDHVTVMNWVKASVGQLPEESPKTEITNVPNPIDSLLLEELLKPRSK